MKLQQKANESKAAILTDNLMDLSSKRWLAGPAN